MRRLRGQLADEGEQDGERETTRATECPECDAGTLFEGGIPRSLCVVAEVAQATEVTIRNRYQEPIETTGVH